MFTKMRFDVAARSVTKPPLLSPRPVPVPVYFPPAFMLSQGPSPEPCEGKKLPPPLFVPLRRCRHQYDELTPVLPPMRPLGFQHVGEVFAAWKRGAVHASVLLLWGFTVDQVDALMNE